MYHERYCRDDNQHHHRDGIQKYTEIDMQLFRQPQPYHIEPQQTLESAAGLVKDEKIFVRGKDR